MKNKSKKKVKIVKQLRKLDGFASDAAKKVREKLVKELGELNEEK